MQRVSVLLICFLAIGLSAAQTVLDECGACIPEDCAVAEGCAAGLVKDKCGCCLVCARREGEKCDNFTLPLPYKHQYGFCGDNLICQLRRDLAPRETPEALCFCKEQSPVCGTDGQTYSSICQLREQANLLKVDLDVQEWAPCKSAPIITSGPEDITGNLKENLALGCEAKGYPIPVLQWEYESSNGVKIKLPSDDQMVAVQVRGGPETYMITSWVQIMELRESDAGIYTCIASNSEGEIKISAQLDVLKARNTRDLPPNYSGQDQLTNLQGARKQQPQRSLAIDLKTEPSSKQRVLNKKPVDNKKANTGARKKAPLQRKNKKPKRNNRKRDE